MNHRKMKRTQWYSNAYKKTYNNFCESIGIVFNISESGISIVGDFPELMPKTMCVGIKLPERLDSDLLELELREIWRTSYKDKDYFDQAGYQFEKLGVDQRKSLSSLMNYLERQKYALIY